eukprot:Selendium_serpulae@DN1462_c0_g1_i1.p1
MLCQDLVEGLFDLICKQPELFSHLAECPPLTKCRDDITTAKILRQSALSRLPRPLASAVPSDSRSLAEEPDDEFLNQNLPSQGSATISNMTASFSDNHSDLSGMCSAVQSKLYVHKQLFKTRMCPFYQNSICKHGAFCTFAHTPEEVQPRPDLSKTRLCDSVKTSTACKNSSCTFAHQRSQLRISDNTLYKVRLCNFNKNGRCLNGADCRFAHGVSELRAPMLQKSSSSKRQKAQKQAPPLLSSSRDIRVDGSKERSAASFAGDLTLGGEEKDQEHRLASLFSCASTDSSSPVFQPPFDFLDKALSDCGEDGEAARELPPAKSKKKRSKRAKKKKAAGAVTQDSIAAPGNLDWKLLLKQYEDLGISDQDLRYYLQQIGNGNDLVSQEKLLTAADRVSETVSLDQRQFISADSSADRSAKHTALKMEDFRAPNWQPVKGILPLCLPKGSQTSSGNKQDDDILMRILYQGLIVGGGRGVAVATCPAQEQRPLLVPEMSGVLGHQIASPPNLSF